MDLQTSNGSSRADRIKLFWSLGASLFWVLLVWGFWERGVFALGVNVAVYLALVVGLFMWELRRHHHLLIKDQLYWLIPIELMIGSFALYDNPFLKAFSVLLLPLLFAFFYNFSFLKDKAQVFWTAPFLARMFERGAGFLGTLGVSAGMHLRPLASSSKHGGIIKRILCGVLLLLVIAVAIIIPMLSAADAAFAQSVAGFMSWLGTLVSTTVLQKVAIGAVFSFFTLAAVLAWGRAFSHEERAKEHKHLDPIISGIVLGGVLALYVLFLGLQVQHLWAERLPFAFDDAEQLVKSGFWQLLFLSLVNICFYLSTYKKTVPAVQKLLTVFTVASLLLLASAAQRMMLYVTTYGLSYEKFFASYAVLFCAIVFVWLIARMFVNKRADVLKFLAVLFLWMYGVVAVLPVEQMVLRANVQLAERTDSQIRLYELTMLSPDVLGLVKHYQSTGQLEEPSGHFDREEVVLEEGEIATEAPNWGDWIKQQEDQLAAKKWYEKNLNNVIYSAMRR